MTAIHVMPNADLREHEETTTCPCGPRVECEPDAAMLVIHNSFDGREATEQDDTEDVP